MGPPTEGKDMTIVSTVSGIPCIIRVDHCFVQEPLGPDCDSDQDCYGYAEIEFTVLDRRGREAPWLTRKLTPDDVERIETEILETP